MLKKILLGIFIVLISLFYGCDTEEKGTIVDKFSVGIVRTATVVPTSFNEGVKTQIQCDSLFLVVKGLPNLKLGSEGFIVTYSTGKKYFICGYFRYRIR